LAFKWSITSFSFKISPLDVLITTPFGFNYFKKSVLTIPFVSGVNGTCNVIISLYFKRSGIFSIFLAKLYSPGVKGSYITTFISKALARFAISLPINPYPTMPNVLPFNPCPTKVPFSHYFDFNRLSAFTICRSIDKRSAKN